jgi:CRP-like cAMP-binding protein
MTAGTVLQQSGEPIDFIHFPVSSMLSLIAVLEDGSEVAVCGFGCDGASHAKHEEGFRYAPVKLVVEFGGAALRVPIAFWRHWLAEQPNACVLFGQYNELVLAEAQHALACHIKHDAESRLCYWLLRMRDWQDGRPIPMTHQALARFMSLRRTTITLLAQGLQDAGIISYRRGAISIIDDYALRQASCECYRTACARNEAFRERFRPNRNEPPLRRIA